MSPGLEVEPRGDRLEAVDAFADGDVAAATPRWAASACSRSWFSGSPYFHISGAAACIAAMTLRRGAEAALVGADAGAEGHAGVPLDRFGGDEGDGVGRAATTGCRADAWRGD